MVLIKVLVVDNNRFFRAGIEQALLAEPGFKVTECQSVKDIMKLIETEQPSLVLLDSNFVSSDFSLAKKLLQENPKVRFIVLSSMLDDSELFDMFRIGVVAYVDKNCEIKELITTIKNVYNGKRPINDILLSRFGTGNQTSLRSENLKIEGVSGKIKRHLTQTDIKVLKYVCNGNSYRQIAESLNVTEQTIKSRMTEIMLKLNANDRGHAVAIALRNGLISFEDIKAK